MPDLSQQRCLNHALREAVARCPECGHFYCRECVTDHDDRIICASCLKKLVAAGRHARFPIASFRLLAQSLAGIVIIWLFFYLIGSTLISIPAAFHEGTLWQKSFWSEE